MAAVIGTGAIVIGTTFQHQTLCENQGTAFSNTAMTIYGVVHGGKQWTFAREQYPDWDKLPSDQYARLLYQASIDKLLSDPLLTWSGLKHGWKLYRERDMPLWPVPYRLAEMGLILLSILVSIALFMRKSAASTLGGLVIGSGLGIYVSAGFISIDGWARVYAATAPFYAFAIPFGISRPLNNLNTKKFLEPRRSLTKSIQYLGALILFGFFLSPQIALIGKTPEFPLRIACKTGEIYAQQRHSPWQTITIAGSETSVAADWLKLSEKSLNLFAVHGDEQKFFSSLRSGQVVVLGTSLTDGILRFSVFDSMSERHMNSDLLEFCIRGRNPNSDWYFYDAYIPN